MEYSLIGVRLSGPCIEEGVSLLLAMLTEQQCKSFRCT